MLDFGSWLVLELFDAPVPIDIVPYKSSFYGKEYGGTFQIGKTEYEVKFEGTKLVDIAGPFLWEFMFGVLKSGEDYLSSERTNEGKAAVVLATVVEALRQFIRKENPESISYTSADPGLARIYKLLEIKFSGIFSQYQKIKQGLFLRKDKLKYSKDFIKYA